MPPRRDVNGEVTSPPISEDRFRTVNDSFQRLFTVLSLINSHPFHRDLFNLETVFQPEIDYQVHIQNLTNALLVVSREKDEELKRLEKTKDEEIDKVKAENEKLKKEKSVFEAQRKAVEAEKKKVQEEKNRLGKEAHDLKEKYKKDKSDLDKKIRAQKLELNEEYSRKSKDKEEELKKRFEKQKAAAEEGIKKEVQDLKSKVDDLTAAEKGLKAKIGRFKAFEKVQSTRIETLESRLQTVDPSHAMSRKPCSDYCQKFIEISDRIAKFADTYFQEVPETDDINITLRLGHQRQLSGVSEIFDFAATLDTDFSKALRKFGVRHFIASELSCMLKQPLFISQDSDGSQKDRSLQDIYSSSKLDQHERTVWRTITLKALNESANFSTLAAGRAKNIVRRIQCLIETNFRSNAMAELANLIDYSLHVWDTIRKDTCRITINDSPPAKKEGCWEEVEIPGIATNGNLDTVHEGQKHQAINTGSFAIFPQIIGEFDREEDSEEQAQETLHPGIALFSDSPIFEWGLAESKMLEKKFKSAHRRIGSISSPTSTVFPSLSIITGNEGLSNGQT